MKKGLRLGKNRNHNSSLPLNYCPDEEGIKTLGSPIISTSPQSLNYCTDEEGMSLE